MRCYLWLIITGCLISTAATAQPRLTIAGDHFEFGATPQNAMVAHFFWFKSTGTDTVQVTEIKTGCDCTTIPLERNMIAPGDSLRVGVYWDTQRKIGNSGRYPYIWIYGQTKPERLYLTANILDKPESSRPLAAKPFRAEFSRVREVSVDSVTIKLSNFSDKPLKLSLASPPMDEYVVRVPDSVPAQSDGTMSIAIASSFLDTEFERSVTIEFDGGTENLRGRLTIPIRRKIFS